MAQVSWMESGFAQALPHESPQAQLRTHVDCVICLASYGAVWCRGLPESQVDVVVSEYQVSGGTRPATSEGCP